MRDDPGARWRSHVWLARSVRLFVLLVPIAAAIAVSLVLAGATSTASQHGLRWWVLLIGLPAIAAIVVGRAARRLLPLAALFRLSLIFPDQAPSRLRVALRSGTVRQLRERIESARHHGLGGDATEAAEYLLELVGALQVHDRRTRGHAERVRALTDLLADELRLRPEDRDRLHWAALLHDIGKVAIPHEILEKPGELSEEEWEILRRHPLEGERLAAPLEGWLGDWAMAIGEHHERWDGLGYPRGLQGTGISRAARIVGVADAFEVMTSARSYKAPVSASAARAELTAQAGQQFDPAIVRAFLRISIGRLQWMLGPLSLLAQVPVTPKLRSAVQRSASGAAAATAGILVATVMAVVVGRSNADLRVSTNAAGPAGAAAPSQTQTRGAAAAAGPGAGPGAGAGAAGLPGVPGATGPTRELAVLPSAYDIPAGDPTTPATVDATTVVAPALPSTATTAPALAGRSPAAGTTAVPTTAAAVALAPLRPAPLRPATTTTVTTVPPVTTSTPPTTVKPAVPTTSTTACPPLARDQKRRDLSGRDLRCYVSLRDYHFDKANLAGANLSGLDLSHANFHDADLRGAILVGADLSHAKLDKADLTGAVLTGARLPKHMH